MADRRHSRHKPSIDPPKQAPAPALIAGDPPPPVLIPVHCRACGTDQLVEYPVPVVVVALTRWNNLLLHACCSDMSWDASPADLDRIRAHLGSTWLESSATP